MPTFLNQTRPVKAATRLPPFLCALLDSPPPAGGGVHGWLFKTARQLHAHLPYEEVEALLASKVANCGRRVPLSEVKAAVRNSKPVAWQPKSGRALPSSASVGHTPPPQPQPTWPPVDEAARERVLASGFGIADLWEVSPVRPDASGPSAGTVLDSLFAPTDLICVASHRHDPVTLPRERFRGNEHRLQFIVPNPMSAPAGRTTDGRESPRCLGNTAARRFLVVEFDSGTPDEHAAIIDHLGNYALCALVVHSGNRSLHGWFRAHPDDGVTRRFFEYAVSLGADPAMWPRCQLVRMPEGLRDNGARQRVWFFNPEAAR